MDCKYNNTIAIKLGVNAALAADYLDRIIKTEGELRDKKRWAKCSGVRLAAIYPHMSRKSASRALKLLTENGLVTRCSYLKKTFDNTYFYSFTEYGKQVLTGDDEAFPVFKTVV